MKRMTFAATLALLITGSAQAQESGKITYEERISFELPVMEGMDSAMMANMPRESKNAMELFYTPEASLYQKAPEKPVENMGEEQNGIVIKMGQPNDRVYADHQSKKVTEQKDFMERLFIVEKDMKTPQWKLSGQQKTILGFQCQEAVIKDSLHTVHVWFTPQISVQAGPGSFLGFPGMVLAVEMDNVVMTAVSIDPTVDKKAIVKPTEGKKMSEEKYEAMVAEKMKEMQEQYGGDGHMVIKVVRD